MSNHGRRAGWRLGQSIGLPPHRSSRGVAADKSGAVKRARLAAGLSQSELARRAGISRQALGAIESGAYQPGVTVALRLARELGRTVEDLFAGEEDAAAPVSAAWIGDRTHPVPSPRAPVTLARVSGRVIAMPQAAPVLGLSPAAGLVAGTSGRRVSVEAFRTVGEIDSTLLVAGCDPGVSILADWLVRHRAAVRVVTVPCSSRAALEALVEGRVHVAGLHLRDPRTGEYNLAPARKRLGRRRATFVNFARWEIGLGVRPERAAVIRAVEDLARPGLRIVNRERGSGARLALDETLERAGLDARRLCGYERELAGHLEVAAAVRSGEADAGVTIRVAAETYGLGFIPLRDERYDLVVPASEWGWLPVKAMLDALNSSRFARELSELCFYDTSRTGKVIGERKTRSSSEAGPLNN